MDTPIIYAICIGGLVIARFALNYLMPWCLSAGRVLQGALFHSFVIHRHALVGPWTTWLVLTHAFYLASNMLCLLFDVRSVKQVAARAGNLAIINAAPLYFSPHLSLVADSLDLRIHTVRGLHGACGIMTAVHAITHSILSMVAAASAGDSRAPGVYAFVATMLLLLLFMASNPFLRHRYYAIFLRLHQALAVGIAFCTIKHLIPLSWPLWPLLYTVGGVFGCSIAAQAGIVLYRNKPLGSPWARAKFVKCSASFKIVIITDRPLRVEAGQYINVWIPSLSLFSSYPFVVTSWSPRPQRSVELLIEPRQRFGRRLDDRVGDGDKPSLTDEIGTRVVFSGPHGCSVGVWHYQVVILFASGFGIASILPYLEKLMHGYFARKSMSRRIHLVWHTEEKRLRDDVSSTFKGYFKEDDGRSQILHVSIYNGGEKEYYTTMHPRLKVYPGALDVNAIIQSEAGGGAQGSKEHAICAKKKGNSHQKHQKSQDTAEQDRISGTARKGQTAGADAESLSRTGSDRWDVMTKVDRSEGIGGNDTRTLVLVSTQGNWRDEIRRATRDYVSTGLDLVELEYQPKHIPSKKPTKG